MQTLINSVFLANKMFGSSRYAIEISKKLKKLIQAFHLLVVNPIDWTKRSKISYIARMESERRFLHGNQEKIQQCNKAYGS